MPAWDSLPEDVQNLIEEEAIKIEQAATVGDPNLQLEQLRGSLKAF